MFKKIKLSKSFAFLVEKITIIDTVPIMNFALRKVGGSIARMTCLTLEPMLVPGAVMCFPDPLSGL